MTDLPMTPATDPMEVTEDIGYQRAVEAVRSGVPNADAVRLLGCDQPAAEARVHALVRELPDRAVRGEVSPGVLVAGDFGSGKSHLLEYLEQMALRDQFVVSRIAISKETPLYDLGKVFTAAIEHARAPGLSGHALEEVALLLDPTTPAYSEFYQWVFSDEAGLSQMFPATLMLHERLRTDQDLVEKIVGFWSGQKLGVSEVRAGLRQIGQAQNFQLKQPRVAQLAVERFRFASRLFAAAGYGGWVLLIDEVELIGRYSLLQRGRSYAELARWIAPSDTDGVPGILAVAAITADFDVAVLQARNDRSLVPERLSAKGTEEYFAMAERAVRGMDVIEREAMTLAPPDTTVLRRIYERLRETHGRAYGWTPPEIWQDGQPIRRGVRSHVRRWVTEWDLRRLYPETAVELEEEELRVDYEESADLERVAEPED